jgi:Protein of unknown function (DUF2793)
MTITPNLSLPYIDVNAAQREVVHNEAIRGLDALVQLSVVRSDLSTPPGSPVNGQRWIVAASPTGAWAGHATHVAAWQDAAWRFYIPRTGWFVYDVQAGALKAWNGSAWVDALALFTALQNLTLLGLGTTADATNPFSAKLNNALWLAKTVAEGGDGDLRFKLSKATAGDTGSLLLQTNASGRAEIGLTGDDDLHFKVSANGSTWSDAVKITAANGDLIATNKTLVGAATQTSTDTGQLYCTQNGGSALVAFQQSAGASAAIVAQVNSTTPFLCAWRHGATLVGTITTNGTGVTYGTSSDMGLKNDFREVTDAKDIVNGLAGTVLDHGWDGFEHRSVSPIAQLARDVLPSMVPRGHGVPGDPDYARWMIDPTAPIPYLLVNVSECNAAIDSLKADLDAVKRRLGVL